MIAMLGADLPALLSPIKVEIRELAQRTRSDFHNAALQLLAERHGCRRSPVEQQLILAALSELQDEAAVAHEAAST